MLIKYFSHPLHLIFLLTLSFLFCSCNAIFPNDKPVEFDLCSCSGKSIRGLQKITIKSDMKVRLQASRGICTGEVAPWLYKELMDSINKMHFKDKIKSFISSEKEQYFTIKANVVDETKDTETFEWKVDSSSTYNEVLLNFKKIQSQVMNTGSCSIEK